MNSLYDMCVQERHTSANPNLKGLPIMKLAIRIFALFVVVAGAAAASTSNSVQLFASHQSATASLPECRAAGPTCPVPPTNSRQLDARVMTRKCQK